MRDAGGGGEGGGGDDRDKICKSEKDQVSRLSVKFPCSWYDITLAETEVWLQRRDTETWEVEVASCTLGIWVTITNEAVR